MYAVITAGGRVDGPFARTIGTEIKALAPFGSSTLLDLAIEAARAAGARGIAVVGGPEIRAHAGSRIDRCLEADADGGINVLRALDAWPGEPLLYLASDLPFVTGAALREFAQRSAPYALTMPLASSAAYAARFPRAPDEHVIALGGERVANGSAFFVAAAAVPPLRSWARRFFAARKSKLRMALLLGPSLLTRFALRTLTIGAIEHKARRVLGINVAALRDADPRLCYDVDTIEDYLYARDLASTRP